MIFSVWVCVVCFDEGCVGGPRVELACLGCVASQRLAELVRRHKGGAIGRRAVQLRTVRVVDVSGDGGAGESDLQGSFRVALVLWRRRGLGSPTSIVKSDGCQLHSLRGLATK